MTRSRTIGALWLDFIDIGSIYDVVDELRVSVISVPSRVEELHELIHPIRARAWLGHELECMKWKESHLAVAYAVTRGNDFAFFLVSLSASLRAVPSGISDI